ncbi:MAG: methyltransferase regulatory domain-containing protein [Nitrospirota bacterium]|nr:methyltransferase regulatory domain-containing protein [Nitrospirota bacterium]
MSAAVVTLWIGSKPGWATRKLVRETLRRNPWVASAAIQDQSKRAVEVATQLLADLPARDYAHAVLLAEELERVKSASPGYLFHEYLTEVNEGFWLCDFVNDARKYSLDYVCDAQCSRFEGYVPPALRSTLKQRNLDPIQQEEMADLLCHRSFHASILCGSDAPPRKASDLAILEHLFIASSLASQSDPFDLTGEVVEHFVGTSNTDITLDTSITKAAVIGLALQWPRGETFGWRKQNTTQTFPLIQKRMRWHDTRLCRERF